MSWAYHQLAFALGRTDLHPGGAAASERLVARLGPGAGRRALEVGPGLGATTRRLVAAGWEVHALEVDPVARAALAAGPARAVHTRLDAAPTVDAVVSESALYAFDLDTVFEAVAARLRPGGRLALCEMVWTDAVTPEVAAAASDASLARYGIRVASRARLTWADWSARLAAAGFRPVHAERLGPGSPGAPGPVQWRRALPFLLRHPSAIAALRHHRRPPPEPRLPVEAFESWLAVWRLPG